MGIDESIGTGIGALIDLEVAGAVIRGIDSFGRPIRRTSSKKRKKKRR